MLLDLMELLLGRRLRIVLVSVDFFELDLLVRL